MSKKIQLILLIITVVMSFTGIAIWGSIRSGNNLNESTTIIIDGETNKTLKADIGNLYPGKSSEYVINLSGDTANEYAITLKFHNDNGGVLKDYVSVEIKTENVTISKTLSQLLDGELISLGDNVTAITLCYTMSADAGNETQGSDIVFFIDLNAKHT